MEISKEHIERLKEALARASVGDYSLDLSMPSSGEEAEVMAGIQMLIETIREKTSQLEAINLLLSSESKQRAREVAQMQILGGFGQWSWNAVTNEIVCSAGVKSLFGFGENEEPDSMEFFSMIHPDDRSLAQTAFNRSAETESSFRLVCRVISREGRQKLVMVKGKGNRLGMPEVRGFIKQIGRRAVRKSLLRGPWAELLQRVGSGIAILDRDGFIIDANERLGEFLGYAAFDLIGEWFFSLSGASDGESRIDTCDRPAMKALMTGKTQEGILTIAGTHRSPHYLVRPIGRGKVVQGVLLVAMDGA